MDQQQKIKVGNRKTKAKTEWLSEWPLTPHTDDILVHIIHYMYCIANDMISFELQDNNQLWPWWFPSLNKCTALHYGCYDIVMTWKNCLSIFTVEFCNILIFSWRKFFMFSSSGLQGESDSSEIVLGPFWRDYFCSNIYGIEFDPINQSQSILMPLTWGFHFDTQ